VANEIRGTFLVTRFELSSRLVTNATRSGAALRVSQAKLRFAPIAAATSGILALALGGCAQQPPQQFAHSSEHFPSAVYGAASPRVLADGETVPRGGGTYLVGHPYMIAGHMYYPSERPYAAVGLASWYGDAFHGRRTANGEIFDRDSISAAHPTMPLPSYARVTNLRNHYSMIVRVNDRGPFAPGRIMDVSRRVADMLDFHRAGTTTVKVEYVGRASLAGSNDDRLVATLRLDGRPAPFNGDYAMPTMLADGNNEPVRTASAEPVAPAAPEALEANATQSDAAADPADASLPPAHVFTGPTPLPPARPFDLATIPGADVPIGSGDGDR